MSGDRPQLSMYQLDQDDAQVGPSTRRKSEDTLTQLVGDPERIIRTRTTRTTDKDLADAIRKAHKSTETTQVRTTSPLRTHYFDAHPRKTTILPVKPNFALLALRKTPRTRQDPLYQDRKFVVYL